MHIHCIQTGGTIDKAYPPNATNHGYNFEITSPAISRVLAEVHFPHPYTITECLKKDSLDITDEDRAHIVAVVTASPHTHILITHGTDTIHITAEALQRAQLDKTIVITGAMLPESMKGSDASFNIGLAIGALQCKATGVYIALSSEILSVESYVQKIAQ